MRIEWNGKKLTKKRALFLCWKLWEWLGENPGQNKCDWPEWEMNGGKVHDMEEANECSCCQHAWELESEEEGTDDGPNCNNCLMLKFWTKRTYRYGAPCCREESAFKKWSPWNKSTMKYAKRIAAAAKRRYEEL